MRAAKGYQILKLETSKRRRAAVRIGARPRRRQGVPGSRTQRRCASSSTRVRRQAIIEWKNEELQEGLRAAGRGDEHAAPVRGQSLTLADHDASPAWYAIWTRSRHEQVVRDQLERKGLRGFSADDCASGAAGRTARRRSTGRSSPAIVSRASIRNDRLPILKCTGVVNIVSFDSEIAPIPEQRDRRHPAAGRRAICSTIRARSFARA